MKKIVFVFFLIICVVQCSSKNHTSNVNLSEKKSTNKEFIDMKNLFYDMNIPNNFKKDTVIREYSDISKSLSKKYFFLKDSDLLFNNYELNFDENIVYDNWVENLPGAIYKINRDEYIILIYGLVKNGVYESSFESKMFTFSHEGEFIDSMTIRSQYTPESDCRECVFLSENRFLIFDYLPNPENIDKKTSRYLDNKRPFTVIDIVEYDVENNGNIHLVKKMPRKYLKEPVIFYREYHSNSDDPINAY